MVKEYEDGLSREIQKDTYIYFWKTNSMHSVFHFKAIAATSKKRCVYRKALKGIIQ